MTLIEVPEVSPVFFRDDKIRVISNGPLGRRAIVSIGDHAIPNLGLRIDIQPNELIEITMTVRADQVDIEALQEQTRIEVISPEPLGE
ncbi:hypothetical protein QN355_11630 [Cryobacterium sp. 10S3]|uniref:hypothetical protein n=1 Tax=Cryobacterium sp. 10S3 TaxID=3048582 RepID=UPI002AC97F20|nr:hypothetical protein [Cryobacterium sp. 10S3]MEB0287204.1 hypothetical protein [Cryobacterium sp. 10S3]WPX14159.1 hypothetical protein RHM57_01950 [Cryobacterium sp. 10S3]